MKATLTRLGIRNFNPKLKKAQRDHQTALYALDGSLALSPSSALAFGFSPVIRAWIGDDATAIEHAKLGIV